MTGGSPSYRNPHMGSSNHRFIQHDPILNKDVAGYCGGIVAEMGLQSVNFNFDSAPILLICPTILYIFHAAISYFIEKISGNVEIINESHWWMDLISLPGKISCILHTSINLISI